MVQLLPRRGALASSLGPVTRRAVAFVAVVVCAAALPASTSGQWIEAPGRGWAQVSVYYHDTRDEFSLTREQIDIRNGGHAVSTSVFLTAAMGLGSGVDAWVQAPYHRIEYSDFGGDRTRSGVGDVRLFLRAAPLSWLGSSFPFAVRGGVKLPVGDFALDAEIIPLGEAQRDWEIIGEIGHSFYPRSMYAMAWVGYRWREFAGQLNRDFGDEPFFLAAFGGNLGAVGYKLTAEGWAGRAPLIEGVRLESASREMLHLTPTLSVPIGGGTIEGGVRLPLAGRNLTAGPAVTVGYFFRFGG